jgi:hypothetical protein
MLPSESILLKPHFYALIITGILIFIIIILIIKYRKNVINMPQIKLIILIALMGNLISNHANLHYIIEKEYNYNPLKSAYIYFNT